VEHPGDAEYADSDSQIRLLVSDCEECDGGEACESKLQVGVLGYRIVDGAGWDTVDRIRSYVDCDVQGLSGTAASTMHVVQLLRWLIANPLADTGDGFGNNGTGGARVALDTEGLVLGDGGSYWISDEYATYIYQFDKKGKMIQAIRTPDAFIPLRNGTTSFSAASPPIYDPDLKIKPEDPTSGRGNNQGLEALTTSPDGKYLYTLLQSATIQDGGKSSSKRRNSRFLTYRVKDNKVELEAEYAVQLPVLPSGRVASQSEMIYVSPTQFLVLARDSGAGHGQDKSESIYRNADVIDISGATNVAGKYDGFTDSIASKDGVLKSEITPATYCPWLSYNNNAQLNRFGVRNGGAQDQSLLNEKWESFAFLPVDDDEEKGKKEKRDKGDGKDYYLISVSDNDFITQDGYINFGKQKYKDASGFDLDTQVLVFKVTLPKGAKPL
jgi:hypothetical protein